MPAEVPTEWEWKLRLFCSADLVGSTAFKSQMQRDDWSPTWAPTFKEFFCEFPMRVQVEYENLPRCVRCKSRLQPWKFLGDEILFFSELTDHREVLTHLLAFKNAVLGFPTKWHEKEVPLGLKAAAWIAGFPVTNTEILIEASDAPVRDFIGPSMDLGFRIAKFADSRRFVLSADLMLMALEAKGRVEIDRDEFSVFFDGAKSLKGVLGDDPYPIVWLDLQDGKQTDEEKLLGIKREMLPDVLTDYLRRFIDHRSPPLLRPFIFEDGVYREVPRDLDAARRRMMEEEAKVGDRPPPESDDAVNAPPDPRPPLT